MKTTALDIETTGTAPDDRITVIGIDTPMGSWLFLNTAGGEYPDGISDRLDRESERLVNVRTHESEQALLRGFEAFVTERFSHDERRPATNSNTLPPIARPGTVGSISASSGRSLVATARPLYRSDGRDRNQFNVSDRRLETAYGELVGEGLNGRDPFDDSGRSVECRQNGAFEPLRQHNLVDIRRTRALVAVAERYYSSSHFSMRSLEPIDP